MTPLTQICTYEYFIAEKNDSDVYAQQEVFTEAVP
jgi:hypothetical protein